MSRVTDIKYRIDQLDGGGFQNLCDAYLYCRGYGSGYSLGMKTGTDKVAKGNPDTYFLSDNKKYVFVVYTTQKQDFVEKTLDDLKKCFDEGKTGVKPIDIEEIICCHTFGRLTPGEDKKLHQFCEAYNVNLNLIGIDEIANDIVFRYKNLAKVFFDMPLETGQIMSTDVFIRDHDANKMSAPLNTEFVFREQELENAKNNLEIADVLVITGPAGTGKTRFALELCKLLSQEKTYEVLVIKSNSLELYEDLYSSIEEDKDYLVLIDDANELGRLSSVLDYLLHKNQDRNCVKKIVITVRDYARQKVLQSVLDVDSPKVIKLGKLKDDEIKSIIEKQFEIKNQRFQERIISIAEGNARLAILAAKHIADGGNIDIIQDVTTLYENYYRVPIEALSANLNTLASAGIIAFLQAIHLDYLDNLYLLFETVGITKTQFINDLHALHDIELINLCNDKAARIADQSLSNYLVKYVFFDKTIIPFNLMVDVCLLINRSQTISNCNMLFSIFHDKDFVKAVENELNIVWDRLEDNPERFPSFFQSFHMLRPTDTLLYVHGYINNLNEEFLDVTTIVKSKNEKGIQDDILKILCSFKNSDQFLEALELVFMYYEKRPKLYEEFLYLLTKEFGFDKNSIVQGCSVQKNVVNFLCSLIEKQPTVNNLYLYVDVAKYYLRFKYSKAEEGRNNTISYYTLNLPFHDVICTYRKRLWDNLTNLYFSKIFPDNILSILKEYGKDGITEQVVANELSSITELCRLLDPEVLYHSLIVQHIQKIAIQAQPDYNGELDYFLEAKKLKIFSVLTNHAAKVDEDTRFDYYKKIELHRENISEMVRDYSAEDYKFLFEICNESICDFAPSDYDLTKGMNYIFELIPDSILESVVEMYLQYDTPFEAGIDLIVQRLFKACSVEDVQRLIWSHDYKQKNSWQWEFFANVADDDITASLYDNLLDFLDNPPLELKRARYREITDLNVYKKIDSNIIIKASKLILSHYDENPFIFDLYFGLLFNVQNGDIKDVFFEYECHNDLLEEIYLKYVAYSDNNDYDGEILEYFIQNNLVFLHKYLDEMLEEKDYMYTRIRSFSKRLRKLWTIENQIELFNSISDYVFCKTKDKRWIYEEIFQEILVRRQGEEDIIAKQDIWIKNIIDIHNGEDEYMQALFGGISNLSCERRKTALFYFLELNSKPESFEHLQLEASLISWSGSEIPYLRQRLEYMFSIHSSMHGIEYIKHKKIIEKRIESLQKQIEEAEIRELLELLY